MNRGGKKRLCAGRGSRSVGYDEGDGGFTDKKVIDMLRHIAEIGGQDCVKSAAVVICNFKEQGGTS